MDVQAAVTEFHNKFCLPSQPRPALPDGPRGQSGTRAVRRELFAEEIGEYVLAEESDDLAGIARELADLVYVLYGTALTYGIDLDAVIGEVHRAKMTMEQVGPTGNVSCGDSYVPPDIDRAFTSASDLAA